MVNLTETNTTLESKLFGALLQGFGFHPRIWKESTKMSHSAIMPHNLHAFSLRLVASFSTVQMIAFVSKENS